MRYYFAPMEGITGYVYRNAHHRYFSSVDKYFTPFLTPNQNRKLSSKEKNDVDPEHNQGIRLVPQILTSHAGDFIWAAREMGQLGYGEVNLNLGCPSKTVVTKSKGSGFLAKPEELDRFLSEIFEKSELDISIKTRIGLDSPDEFCRLLEIYNQYPVKELIIHPRVQKDYYDNTPNLAVFHKALKDSKNPVCYNGNIFKKADYSGLMTRFPDLECLMLGRGLVANPGLAEAIGLGKMPDKGRLREFHDMVCEGYQDTISGDRNVLFRMKEFWFYLITMFRDGKQAYKKIKKAERMRDYEAAVDRIFAELDMAEDGGYADNKDNLR